MVRVTRSPSFGRKGHMSTLVLVLELELQIAARVQLLENGRSQQTHVVAFADEHGSQQQRSRGETPGDSEAGAVLKRLGRMHMAGRSLRQGRRDRQRS